MVALRSLFVVVHLVAAVVIVALLWQYADQYQPLDHNQVIALAAILGFGVLNTALASSDRAKESGSPPAAMTGDAPHDDSGSWA